MYPQVAQFDGEGAGLQPSPAVTADASASPVTAVQSANNAIGANRMAQASYSGSMSGAAKTTKPVDKSSWDRSTKVSPNTVAAVKDLGRGNMGAKAATDAFAVKPRVIGGVLSSGPVGASREQKEATKRVYPSAYRNAAGTNFKSSPGPSDIANIKR
jgi:hypothetical protein